MMMIMKGGRAVPYTLSSNGGACGLPTIGIYPANVNDAFFDGGVKCGSCYEVTGPLGTQIVQVNTNSPSSLLFACIMMT